MNYNDEIDCCANCKHIISHEKGNRYGDMEHFCLAIGYLITGIYKDAHKHKHLTPGGRELPCRYERK